MIELRLAPATTKSDRIFYWHSNEYRCSFRTDVDAYLKRLGPPTPLAVDLVRLGTLVYLVDRTQKRPPKGWARNFALTVPCSDAGRWNAAATRVDDMLFFLTGDTWHTTFVEQAAQPPKAGIRLADADVLLYSGGADGQAGAALANDRPWLVALWDHGGTKGRQREAKRALTTLRPGSWPWTSVRLARRPDLPVTGTVFGTEPSSRSRSLVYMAFGIAAASLRGKRLVIAENGFLSVNAPLLPERRGALSTRTTHPAFVSQLRAVLAAVGIDVQLHLPFSGLTKGDVFALVAKRYDRGRASRLLSATHSCAKPNRREVGVDPMMHCGVCYACLVRRGGFLAARVDDLTPYRDGDLEGAERVKWLRQHGNDVAAVRAALTRGVSETELLASGLPADVDFDATFEMVQRGMRELALAAALV